MVPQRIVVKENSQVSEARRAVARLAQSLGFSERETGTAALLTTELATNLVKHTSEGGEIAARSLVTEEARGLELLVLDKGPGIGNIARALTDGFSTAGSPGTGLGAVSRMATRFEIYSRPAEGTAVLIELWQGGKGAAPAAPGGRRSLTAGGINVPHANETASGDAWATGSHEGRWLALVVDGLGHGLLASEVADTAVKTFRRNLHLSAQELMTTIDRSLRAGRGGVGAIAELDGARRQVTFVGVGNISGVIVSGSGTRNMVSHNGTLGQEARRIQGFTYPWEEDSLLVMHTDGLKNRWDLNDYPGLGGKAPSLVAGVLYRDYSRGRDDVAVLVAREARR